MERNERPHSWSMVCHGPRSQDFLSEMSLGAASGGSVVVFSMRLRLEYLRHGRGLPRLRKGLVGHVVSQLPCVVAACGLVSPVRGGPGGGGDGSGGGVSGFRRFDFKARRGARPTNPRCRIRRAFCRRVRLKFPRHGFSRFERIPSISRERIPDDLGSLQSISRNQRISVILNIHVRSMSLPHPPHGSYVFGLPTTGLSGAGGGSTPFSRITFSIASIVAKSGLKFPGRNPWAIRSGVQRRLFF